MVACDVVVGWAVVVVGDGVVVLGDSLVVVLAGGCVDDGGGAGITVTVVLSPGPVIVTVCDVCGG
ncbi:MAG TPA: hypothetical protein VED43_06095, partial [Mycobacterium sp.]|nr:hypothetical protein [Mycobacterium sp.]